MQVKLFHASAKPPRVRVYQATVARTGEVLCEAVWMPGSSWGRLRGLLGRSALERSAGLLLEPSSGVHTFGMRYPIDVLALDGQREVVAVRHAVPPFRMCGATWRTRSILELAPGRLREAGVCRGDQILITPRS